MVTRDPKACQFPDLAGCGASVSSHDPQASSSASHDLDGAGEARCSLSAGPNDDPTCAEPEHLSECSETSEEKYERLEAALLEEHEDLICAICLSFLVKPRLLPCGHAFCFVCLMQTTALAFDGNNCPLCRVPFGVPDINQSQTDLEDKIQALISPDLYGKRKVWKCAVSWSECAPQCGALRGAAVGWCMDGTDLSVLGRPCLDNALPSSTALMCLVCEEVVRFGESLHSVTAFDQGPQPMSQMGPVFSLEATSRRPPCLCLFV